MSVPHTTLSVRPNVKGIVSVKPGLYFVYFGSGMAVGLALVALSLARGIFVGVVAGAGWSAICIARLIIGPRSHSALPNQSRIAWFLGLRRKLPNG